MKLLISFLLIGGHYISAFNLLGIDFPDIQLLDNERGPGMPYLHTDKVKLGRTFKS